MSDDESEVSDECEAPVVLLADDDYDIACELATCLHAHGCKVFIEASGDRAVAIAEAYKPDILILDIEMPGLNGYEVARYIRKQPWGHRPVLIAHTGLIELADRKEASDAGFDFHLSKPFRLKAISDLIRGCGYRFVLQDPTNFR